MPIDYSKWDKIELSDDSDVEVHPNVDKRSFIRWRQQDIHQKRDERNREIALLETQVPMYEELNRRVGILLAKCGDSVLANYQQVCDFLSKTFDSSKPPGVEEDAPTYNEMIEDLFTDIKGKLETASLDPNDGKLVREQVANHTKKIEDVLSTQRDKLQTLYKERELHISSEDMHTGWDRSFLNKDSDVKKPEQPKAQTVSEGSTTGSASAASSTSTTTKATTTSTSTSSSTPVTKSVSQKHNELSSCTESDEEALAKYSEIPYENLVQIRDFLKTHTNIITQANKDSLLMSAFDSEFDDDHAKTKRIVGVSILLQYVLDVLNFKKIEQKPQIQQVVQQLFDKMMGSGQQQVMSSFQQELASTFDHIQTRCKVLRQEQLESGELEGTEKIQLKSLDDDTTLVVNLPDSESSDPTEQKRVELFKSLPERMQQALQTGTLDEVNNVFHGMPIEEAEHILEIFDEADIIGVRALVENESDWEQLKGEYEQNLAVEDHQHQPVLEELPEEGTSIIPTSDLVD